MQNEIESHPITIDEVSVGDHIKVITHYEDMTVTAEGVVGREQMYGGVKYLYTKLGGLLLGSSQRKMTIERVGKQEPDFLDGLDKSVMHMEVDVGDAIRVLIYNQMEQFWEASWIDEDDLDGCSVESIYDDVETYPVLDVFSESELAPANFEEYNPEDYWELSRDALLGEGRIFRDSEAQALYFMRDHKIVKAVLVKAFGDRIYYHQQTVDSLPDTAQLHVSQVSDFLAVEDGTQYVMDKKTKIVYRKSHGSTFVMTEIDGNRTRTLTDLSEVHKIHLRNELVTI